MDPQNIRRTNSVCCRRSNFISVSSLNVYCSFPSWLLLYHLCSFEEFYLFSAALRILLLINLYDKHKLVQSHIYPHIDTWTNNGAVIAAALETHIDKASIEPMDECKNTFYEARNWSCTYSSNNTHISTQLPFSTSFTHTSRQSYTYTVWMEMTALQSGVLWSNITLLFITPKLEGWYLYLLNTDGIKRRLAGRKGEKERTQR